jgi:type VI secretion system secreted protein VgrG
MIAGATMIGTPVLAQPVAPSLGGAESFAALGGASVAATGASTFGGDVGVDAGGTVTGVTAAMLAPGSTLHEGDAVAAQAHHDATTAYADLAGRTCLPANNLTGQNLGGLSLAAGVYCFDADAPLTGTLTLTGAGPWIFQVGGALTVAASASVVAPIVAPATCGGSNVFWQIGDDDPTTALVPSTIATGAAFVGNILALGNVALAGNATVDGRVISVGELLDTTLSGGEVTTEANTVTACSFGNPLPTYTPFKVTGGGSINVPNDPTETDPDATGTGRANYGF